MEGQNLRSRPVRMLWFLLLLGIGYGALLYSRPTLTGKDHVDGVIGVVVGLYICSHPAANMVDLFFYRDAVWDGFSSRLSFVLWLLLNAGVLVSGWFAIFVGTTRLVGRAG